ncbi:MAG: hypothetical protein EOM54_13530 [Clostridia bacterium]|nr:hypothetical protein [Clostridia bacterium]
MISGDREVTQMICDISNTISNACRAIGELYAEAQIYEGVLCETEETEANADDAPKAEAKPEKPAEEPAGTTEAQTPAK